MRLPPLNALRYFLEAAEKGSFKSAAESLFVTQAAISQHIRTLEQQLNCKLFDRKNKQKFLTEEGEKLLPHVQRAFSELNHGVNALKADPNPNTLNISVLPSFASCWLIGNIVEFQQQHPHLHIRIEPSLTLHTFDDSGIDVAIRFGLGNYPELDTKFLSHDTFYLAANPELMNQNNESIESLKAHNLVLDESSDIENAWRILFKQHDIDKSEVKPFLTVNDASMTVQAVMKQQGIGMLRKSLILPQLEMGQLVTLFDFEKVCDYAYYLAAPKRNFKRPKVQLFEQWITERLARENF